ncbi:MAG: M14 family zinc carboxypeptidase [Thermoplasmata archaeon]
MKALKGLKPPMQSRLRRALLIVMAVQCLILPLPPSSASDIRELGSFRAGYHTYDSMTQELRALEASHPDLVMVESLGRTYEDRDIWAVKISDDVRTNDSAEPDVLIMGGLHAREIMGVEVPLYLINYLIKNYGTNETCTMLVNTREVWFVPMANPDGHVYVERGNDWRKNRRPTVGGNIGVDLNRNWGYMFGVDAQTSDDPSSDVYHGPYPFSENETRAISELALRQRFATSLSFHSYGQLILYPWGFTTDPAPDSEELERMARAMAAINGYTPQQSSRLYLTHGDSEDWLYANTSTLAFTFELDTSFYPPASQIETTCSLNCEAVIYLIAYPKALIVDAGVVAISSPTPGAIVEPDRPLNITATVMNFGTDASEIPIEIEVSSADGYLHTNSTSVTLRPGQLGEAFFQWFPPFPGSENYTLAVRTKLGGDHYSWNDERTTQFKIRTKYGAALSADETSKECFPGQSAIYRLTVMSLSNREDCILLELEGARRDLASIVDSIHLPPGGAGEVNLTVRIPRDASPGERVYVAVRALSSTGQGASGLVSTVTTVLDPSPVADAGPDIMVDVMEEVEFDATASTSPAGAIVRYSWEFGDGTTAEGLRVRHAYSRRGLYTVNLTVENEFGWSDTDSLLVTVIQNFSLRLETPASELSLRPAETKTINLTLRNMGNGADEVEVKLDALKWSASIDRLRISLQRGESAGITLCITAPERATAGSSAMFRVTAASLESPYARDEVIIRATVAEVRDLNLMVEEREGAVEAGGSVRFIAIVENKGNVNETLVLVAAEIPEEWRVAFSQQELTIPPWSNASVEILVCVPARALAGVYRLFVNGLGLEVSVRARYGLTASVEPLNATARPGGRVVFTINFTNMGNAPDSFTLNVSNLPLGWGTDPPLPPSEVAPGANGSMHVSVQIPEDVRSGRYDIVLELRSDNYSGASVSLPVRVVVERQELPPTNSTVHAFPSILWPPLALAAAGAVLAIYLSRRRKKCHGGPAKGWDVDSWPGAGEGAENAPAGPLPQTDGWDPRIQATRAVSWRELEPWETCLWCFGQLGREPSIPCPSCGGTFHRRCAQEARGCTRCGGPL